MPKHYVGAEVSRENEIMNHGECTQNALIFTPLPPTDKMAHKRFGHKSLCKHPSFQQTYPNPNNTISTHFVIFEIALGPLRPFAVPNKYPS